MATSFQHVEKYSSTENMQFLFRANMILSLLDQADFTLSAFLWRLTQVACLCTRVQNALNLWITKRFSNRLLDKRWFLTWRVIVYILMGSGHPISVQYGNRNQMIPVPQKNVLPWNRTGKSCRNFGLGTKISPDSSSGKVTKDPENGSRVSWKVHAVQMEIAECHD